MLRAALVLALTLIAVPATAPAATGAPKRKQPAYIPALRVIPERVFTLSAKRIALAHQTVRFRALVRAGDYRRGQVLSIRVLLDGKRYVRVRRTVKPYGSGGVASVDLKAHRLGTLRAHADGAGLRAKSRSVSVIRRSAGSGQRGLHVVFLQHRLRDLRYLVGLTGIYDGSTRRAVMAYRKVNRMDRNFSASRTIFARLARKRGRFVPKYPRHGKHVETDLSRQVLVLIDRKGKVFRILHASTGASGTPTIRGSFRIYAKTPGVNSLGMVHSLYFIGGYAIHGYASVPAYPASHGCLRIPIPNARFVHRWLDYGDRVDVYR